MLGPQNVLSQHSLNGLHWWPWSCEVWRRPARRHSHPRECSTHESLAGLWDRARHVALLGSGLWPGPWLPHALAPELTEHRPRRAMSWMTLTRGDTSRTSSCGHTSQHCPSDFWGFRNQMGRCSMGLKSRTPGWQISLEICVMKNMRTSYQIKCWVPFPCLKPFRMAPPCPQVKAQAP